MSRQQAGPPPIENQQRQLTVSEQRFREVGHLLSLEGQSRAFQALLGSPQNVERFKAVALHALSQNSNVLKDCHPLSIVEAIRESAALGLEPTGLLGEGWILPYGATAKFQPGYRGYLKLLRNSGHVARVDAQVVYMNDEFEHWRDETGVHFRHVPLLFGERDEEGELLQTRGDYRGAYAVIAFRDGTIDFEWMPTVDINKIRDSSPSVKAGRATPWNDHWSEMAKKTVLRRLIKRQDLDTLPRVAQALRHEEAVEEQEYRQVEVRPSSSRALAAGAAAAALAAVAGTPEEEAQRSSETEAEALAEAELAVDEFRGPTHDLQDESDTPGPPSGYEGDANRPCNAQSPYNDQGFCTRGRGHGGMHQFGRSTWN